MKFSSRCAGLILLLWMLAANNALSQQGNIFTNFKSNISRADQHFEDNAFVSAIELYKAVLEKEPGNNYAKIKIARAYKKINNAAEAEKWFRAAIENNPHSETIDQLYFAQVLMTNGKHEEAKSWLVKYTADKKDIRALNNLLGIQQLETFFKDSATFNIQDAGVNSPGNDFSPVFFDSMLIFLSNREKYSPVKWVNTWTGNGFFDVYKADLENGVATSDPKIFHRNIKSRFHEGPLSFYNKGTQMIFTRSIDQKEAKGKNSGVLGLFTAERTSDGKGWGNIQPFPFNHTQYAVFHPAINERGDTLYFVSEMPGGYGGGDIYRSVMQDGKWSKPENMGSQINTEGNELFPYLQGQTLYFSSDGHAGLGGLDIYEVALYKDQEFQILNLGYPLNSTYDDFSIAWQETGHLGAFSSNRPHGAGSDDIYFFRKKPLHNHQIIAVNGRVIDKNSGDVVKDALVYIIDEELGTDHSIRTDKAGKFTFEGLAGNSYTLLADKDNKSGLLSGKVLADPEEIVEIEIWGFPPYVTVEAEIKDSISGEPLKLATAQLEQGGNIVSQAQSSFAGKAVLTGNAGSRYHLRISSTGYTEIEKEISIPETDFSDTVKIVIALEKVRPQIANVSGSVIDAAQKTALPSAKVYVINEQSAEQVVFTADEEGRFSFEVLLENTYKIIAEVEDNRTVVSNYKVGNPADSIDNAVLLPIAIKSREKKHAQVPLHIAMQDKNLGEGIPFGVVKLFSEDTIRVLDYTNLEGDLSLNVEKGKEYTLKSDVIGYKESSMNFSTAGFQDSDTILLSLLVEKLESRIIHGVALDMNSGEPIDAAKIYIVNTSTGEEYNLVSAVSGAFSVKAKEGEKLSLLAEKDGKSGIINNLIITERHFNNPLHLRINSTSDKKHIAVHVTDKSGDNLPLAQIQLKQNDVPQQQAKSDMLGMANLHAKSGLSYWLEVRHVGYKTKNLPLDFTKHFSDTVHLSVMLEKHAPNLIAMKGGALIEGTKPAKPRNEIRLVNRAKGESSLLEKDSAGETYAVVEDDSKIGGRMPGVMLQEPVNNLDEENLLPFKAPDQISPLKADLRNIALNTKSIDQIIAENQIQFGEITGIVYDKTDGGTIKDASVQIINNTTGETHLLRTDQQGQFRFIGKAGQVLTALAETDTRMGLFPELQVTHLDDTLKLGISRLSEEAVLHVQVLDEASHAPIKLASVTLIENGNMIRQEQTQISGAVFIRAKAGGKYVLGLKGNQHDEKFLDIDVPENRVSDTVSVTVQLKRRQPQLVTLTGHVVDDFTGKGVDSVLVYVMNGKTWDVETVETDSNGEFIFKGSEGENYQLIGEKNLRGTNLVDVTIRKDQKPLLLKLEHAKPGSTDQVRQVLLELALIDKSTGKPIQNGVLKISRQDTVKQTVYTDVEGRKMIKVDAGVSYYLEGRMKDYQSAGQKLIAQTQNTSDTIQVRIALEPIEKKEAIISGLTIAGYTLEPVTEATIFIQNLTTGEEEKVAYQPGGGFQFSGTLGNTYTILAEKAESRGSLNHFVLRESAIHEPLEVKLYPVSVPLVVKVIVTDKVSGAEVSLASLSLQYQDVYQQKIITDLAGKGTFHVQSGRDYLLEISHPAYLGHTSTISAANMRHDSLFVEVQLEKDVPLVLAIHGHVYDVVSKKPLSEANMYIINDSNQEVLEFKADRRGDFSFQATEGYTYTILADNAIRSGMITDLLITDPSEKANPFVKIPAFGVLEPVVVSARIVDEVSGTMIPGALVKQYSQNTLIREGITDGAGRVIWEEYKNDGYYLVAEHKDFTQKIVSLNFGNVGTGDTVFVTIAMKPVQTLSGYQVADVADNLIFRNIQVIHIAGGEGQVFLSMDQGIFAYKHLNGKAVLENHKELVALSEGMAEEEDLYYSLLKILEEKTLPIEDTVLIQNVYYGFDKAGLSKKAIAELNHIARIMKRHPDINVELKAYTDSRGPASYNKELAKKRVDAAFRYLVQNEIAEGRIIRTPVGEADFIKDCSKEPCTENDHRLNRRTEMLIRYEVEMLGSN